VIMMMMMMMMLMMVLPTTMITLLDVSHAHQVRRTPCVWSARRW
jgi:hypothetical protein